MQETITPTRGGVVISLSDRRRMHARARRRPFPLKRLLVTCWFAAAVVASVTLIAATGILVYRSPAIGLPVLVLFAGLGCWPAAGRWLDRADERHPSLARRFTARRSSRRAGSAPAAPRTSR